MKSWPIGLAPLQKDKLTGIYEGQRHQYTLCEMLLLLRTEFLCARCHEVVRGRDELGVTKQGEIMSAVVQTIFSATATHWLLAIFFANRAFTPMPWMWFAVPFVLALPSGAWGTTTCAACDGLCRG